MRRALPIGAFRRDPPRRRLGQRLVERDQRFALERTGVAARACPRHAAGVDDALRLGIGDQLPFRAFEVARVLAICCCRKLRA